MEQHKRSMVKSIIWRIIGIIILALITYIFTRSWMATTLITFLHHFTFIFVYYFHERFWLWLRVEAILKYKKWIRPFTYEIILGNLILGIITYLITGDVKIMTLVTLTYIFNKLWIYIVYDWIWNRYIKWGLK